MPATKRGAHSGHVSSQRVKMAREAKKLDEQEQAVEHRRGMAELQNRLKNGDADARLLLKRCQQQVAIADVKVEDADRFSSDMEGRLLKRAPATFLKNEWLTQVPDNVQGSPGILRDPKAIGAIVRVNKHAPLQLLYRLACVSEDTPFGPMLKTDWLRAYWARIAAMGGWPAGLILNPDFSVNFESGGHYRLIPPVPAGVAPADHKYRGFEVCGKECLFSGVLKDAITGEWVTSKNYDHLNAFVAHPLQLKHATKFLEHMQAASLAAVVPMTFEVTAPVPAIRRLEDVSQSSTVRVEEVVDDLRRPALELDSTTVPRVEETSSAPSSSRSSSGNAGTEQKSPLSPQAPATHGGIVITVPTLRPAKAARKVAALQKLTRLVRPVERPMPMSENEETAGAGFS